METNPLLQGPASDNRIADRSTGYDPLLASVRVPWTCPPPLKRSDFEGLFGRKGLTFDEVVGLIRVGCFKTRGGVGVSLWDAAPPGQFPQVATRARKINDRGRVGDAFPTATPTKQKGCLARETNTERKREK
jgi:hypothetical protein